MTRNGFCLIAGRSGFAKHTSNKLNKIVLISAFFFFLPDQVKEIIMDSLSVEEVIMAAPCHLHLENKYQHKSKSQISLQLRVRSR